MAFGGPAPVFEVVASVYDHNYLWCERFIWLLITVNHLKTSIAALHALKLLLSRPLTTAL